jgi:hypothetical protein
LLLRSQLKPSHRQIAQPIRLFSINVFGAFLAFRKFSDNYKDHIRGDPLLWVYLRYKEPEDPKRRFGDRPRSFSS